MKQTGQIIGDEPAGCVKNSKYCYDSIPKWGFGVSSEGVGQVRVGTWLQLIVTPTRLYVGDCPSISEGEVKGLEVSQRFGGSEVSLEKSE